MLEPLVNKDERMRVRSSPRINKICTKKYSLILLSITVFIVQRLHAQEQAYPSYFIVSQNGTGNFKTIQEAINAVRDFSQQKVTIYIKNGVYKEKIIIPSWKTNIKLIGEDKQNTVIIYDDFRVKSM